MKLWINNPTCCSPQDRIHTFYWPTNPHPLKTKAKKHLFAAICLKQMAASSSICQLSQPSYRTFQKCPHTLSSSLPLPSPQALFPLSLSLFLHHLLLPTPLHQHPHSHPQKSPSLININVSSHVAGQGLLTAKWSSHRIMKPLGSRWEDRRWEEVVVVVWWWRGYVTRCLVK